MCQSKLTRQTATGVPQTAGQRTRIFGWCGEHQAARELNEDTLARRRALGDDHLDTRISASFALVLIGYVAGTKARKAMETMKAAWSSRDSGRQPDS
jgi:hypothetical protein